MKVKAVTIFLWGVKILLTILFLQGLIQGILKLQAKEFNTRTNIQDTGAKFPQITMCPFYSEKMDQENTDFKGMTDFSPLDF